MCHVTMDAQFTGAFVEPPDLEKMSEGEERGRRRTPFHLLGYIKQKKTAS